MPAAFLADLLGGRAAVDEEMVVVDLDRTEPGTLLPAALRAVAVGITSAHEPHEHPASAVCDLALRRDDVDALEAVRRTVTANPLASVALAFVLRGTEGRSVDDGLLIESATYSTLQAGPEFAHWRATRPRRPVQEEDEPVVVQRAGDRLDVELCRPERHNAFNTAMRDALIDALRAPAVDDTIRKVHLAGRGPSFCAGGDLDEFGTFTDPATAHVLRLQQSVGRAVWIVADRVTAHLHGACLGSGIEIPAFAGEVRAAPDTVIALPELALGLIPGAGGTVSIPRRIGRHRTARLALTGERIDAATALLWGLVDQIHPAEKPG